MEYLAHLRRDDNGQVEEQTTKEHLVNVSRMMQSYGKNMGISHLAALTGILHDYGKLSEEFNGYLRFSFAHPEDKSRRGTVNHSSAGALLLQERYGDSCDTSQFVIEIAASVILSHHTGLLNFIGVDGASDYLRRMQDDISLASKGRQYFFAEVMTETALDALFAAACEEITVLDQRISAICRRDCDTYEAEIGKYSFYCGMVEKMLFSMLVDADRLDTAEFMLGRNLVRQWDEAALWQDFSGKLEKRLKEFVLPLEPHARQIAEARMAISDACLTAGNDPPGIYRLSVPTGSGKTLASMRFALQQARKFGKKRIIMVIPYTSIIDQNASELRQIFACDEAILEHHSNVVIDEEARQQDDYDERAVWRRILTERWDVPVIFTTQVQFLNTLFAGGSRSIRRLHALEDSVIIFDEIQTLPVHCTFMFNEAMNFLKDFSGVTAVLCTATQPTLSKLAVPLLMADKADMVPGQEHIFETFRRVHIENDCVVGGYDADGIAAQIYQSAEERGDVLCIVNLTSEARMIYQSLMAYAAENDHAMEVVHLSTKMCPAHRKKVLEHVRLVLAARRHGVLPRLICVSTQLIEAGVDVSFSTVYRALAGFSSIVQAAGRCNRHGELANGLVRLFNFQGENLSHLPDIALGTKIAREMLHQEAADIILQPDKMQQYFQRYYAERSSRCMSYPTKDGNTLLDLLSLNRAGGQIRDERGKMEQLWHQQAFRDAGREFQVISTSTTGIIVPYAEGKQLILSFDALEFDKQGIQEKIKKAQQYMVNVFSYELEALSASGAVWETRAGVLALREEYYDGVAGIRLAEQKNEFCMI